MGLSFDQTATKKAVEARSAYAKDERLELLNEAFDKARDLLPDITEAAELQRWSVAVATLIDKRRLEEGKATARTETVDPARRERIRSTIDELAARRRRD